VSVSCAHCARLTRMPQSDSRLPNRRQRTQGSELCPLRHLRDHRGSRLATDSVLRNDRTFGRVAANWSQQRRRPSSPLHRSW
jgi:hypothetical protein